MKQHLWLKLPATQVLPQIHCIGISPTKTKRLVLTVHARIEQSQAVQLWHSQFHQMLDHLIIEKLIANGLLKEQAVVIATAGTFIVEGLLTHPHSSQQRDSVIDWLIAQTFSTV
jgi:TetR/AcrR family transcriptional regulator of autoinduction and epiphytic fitness